MNLPCSAAAFVVIELTQIVKSPTLLTEPLLLPVLYDGTDFEMILAYLIANVILFESLQARRAALDLTGVRLTRLTRTFASTSLSTSPSSHRATGKHDHPTRFAFGFRVLEVSDEPLSSVERALTDSSPIDFERGSFCLR